MFVFPTSCSYYSMASQTNLFNPLCLLVHPKQKSLVFQYVQSSRLRAGKCICIGIGICRCIYVDVSRVSHSILVFFCFCYKVRCSPIVASAASQQGDEDQELGSCAEPTGRQHALCPRSPVAVEVAYVE